MELETFADKRPSNEMPMGKNLYGKAGWQEMKSMFAFLLMLMLGSVPAWAALGQYEGSVALDQSHMRAEDHVQAFQAYKVHMLTTTNGVTVREFVSPQGMVFGVSWGDDSNPT